MNDTTFSAPHDEGVAPVEPHDHVVLDQDVLWAYQEVEVAAAMIPEPDRSVSMRAALRKLDDALALSLLRSELDPAHHAQD